MVEVTGAATEATSITTVIPCCHIHFHDDHFIVLKNEDDQWEADVYIRTLTFGSTVVSSVVTVVTTANTLIVNITEYDTIVTTIDRLRYAKASEKFEHGPIGYQVACRECASDGTVLDGDGFDVYLLPPSGLMPAVYKDDVIGWKYDYAGDYVCITDCCDDKPGVVKHWQGTEGAIPNGWHRFGTDETGGQMIIGPNVEDFGDLADESPVGATGGYRFHGSAQGSANNHLDHSNHRHIYDDMPSMPGPAGQNILGFEKTDGLVYTGLGVDASPNDPIPYLGHSGAFNIAGDTGDTDNRPPYYAVYHITRTMEE
jgi:hypothetical protein